MNMKKLVVSLFMAGMMVAPLTQAAPTQLKSYSKIQLTANKAQGQKAAAGYEINIVIPLEQAYQALAAKSSGQILGAYLNLDYGVPNYEFLIRENNTLKSFMVNGETAAVISEETITEPTFTAPSVTLTQAISAAEAAVPATAFSAELEQDEKHAAYRIGAGTDKADYDVIVSVESGKVLMAYKDKMEQEDDEGEGDTSGDQAPTLVPLSQAITAAQQAVAGGTVIGIDLDMGDDFGDFEDDWEGDGEGDDWEGDDEGDDWDDDWESDSEGDDGEGEDGGEGNGGFGDRWDDWGWDAKGKQAQKVKPSSKDGETNGEAEKETVNYTVSVLAGKFMHEVVVDATTGTVTAVNKDPEQALDAAINTASKWASSTTVIANAKAAQAGKMDGIDLGLDKDGKLVYSVYIEGSDNKYYIVLVDPADGKVLKVETLDMDTEMDDETK